MHSRLGVLNEPICYLQLQAEDGCEAEGGLRCRVAHARPEGREGPSPSAPRQHAGLHAARSGFKCSPEALMPAYTFSKNKC